ncbi:MAG: hypothetical protein LBL33_05820, partial [Tannerella sp.]|nr:hypothetical protein [Tannerella sp.]
IPLIEEYGYKLQESEDVDAQMWWNQRTDEPYNKDEHLSYKEALGLMKSNYERRITQLNNYIRSL